MPDITGLSSLVDFGGKMIDRLWPDPKVAAEQKMRLAEMAHNGELQAMAQENGLLQGQIEINKIEAASSSIFVAGWRPGVGWMCAAGFGFWTVGLPICQMVAHWIDPANNPVPVVNENLMTTVLLGMLGLGAARTLEKVKGVAGVH